MQSDIALGILLALLFISVIALFLVVVIKLYIHKVKSYTRLIFQKDLDAQKAINTAIHETQEQTLNNISQDLHDDAGQQLTYINFQLENLKLDSPEMEKALGPITESVGRLSASVRNISHSLNNQLLLQQDLFKAIRAEAQRLETSTNLSIEINGDQRPRDFDNNEKIIIFRIFQEAINNCLKHAKAAQITINLQTVPFKMIIADNGRGFDQARETNATLGLHGMVNRAKIINFKLDIESKPGDGTTVRLTEND